MDDTQQSKPILFGYSSMGVQVAHEFLTKYPHTVKALVFINGQ